MQTVVGFPVEPFLTNFRTDLDLQINVDGDETSVEQLVKVGTKEQPVLQRMWSSFGVRKNVCGLQYRQCAFPCNGAATLVGVGDNNLKTTLTKARFTKYGSPYRSRSGSGTSGVSATNGNACRA